MQLTLAEIAHALNCPVPAAAGLVDGYSIDSRTIRPHQLFFAIQGERDGHEFVLPALGAGAMAAVVNEEAFARFAPEFRGRLLPVPDTLQALQRLAAVVRHRWGHKIAAITGSAGKTTTKEMVARVLGTRYQVLKTEGNLNNHLGVPLTLLRLTGAHELAVLEMGMNHPGEIAALARIAAPEVGIFTNVGPVHLGFFPSLEAIAAAKRELAEALPENGVAILNADDERVRHFADARSLRRVYYSRTPSTGEVRPDDWTVSVKSWQSLGEMGGEAEVVARMSRDERASRPRTARLRLPLLGGHNLSNALAALGTGLVFGVDLEAGAAALAAMAAADRRGEILRWDGRTVINDCYNSNPMAVQQMLEASRQIAGARHIAVLGEMLELGEQAPELHRAVGRMAAQLEMDALFAVRGAAVHLIEGARSAGFRGVTGFFETPEGCGEHLRDFLRSGDVVLFKASRGVKLERALEMLRPSGQVQAG